MGGGARTSPPAAAQARRAAVIAVAGVAHRRAGARAPPPLKGGFEDVATATERQDRGAVVSRRNPFRNGLRAPVDAPGRRRESDHRGVMHGKHLWRPASVMRPALELLSVVVARPRLQARRRALLAPRLQASARHSNRSPVAGGWCRAVRRRTHVSRNYNDVHSTPGYQSSSANHATLRRIIEYSARLSGCLSTYRCCKLSYRGDSATRAVA